MEKKINKSGVLTLLLICLIIFLPGRGWAAGTASETGTGLNQTNLTLTPGGQFKLKLQNAFGTVAWSSSDAKVAVVDKGKVTAVGKGKCSITAQNAGNIYTCAVTVENLFLNYTSLNLVSRRHVKLEVKGYAGKCIWKSSKTSVAQVDASGNVIARKSGKCTVTAQCGKAVLTCSIRVRPAGNKSLNMYANDISSKGRILLAGSSSLDQWRYAFRDFAPREVLNMGVGGTTVTYWIKWYRQLVVSHSPSAVVVYVGSNDLEGGADTISTLNGIKRLLNLIRRDLKTIPIFYVSICPCWGRRSAWNAIKQINKKMKIYCKYTENVYYLDLVSAFTDSEGRPIRNLFKSDQIHPNSQGYKLWKQFVADRVLKEMGKA